MIINRILSLSLLTILSLAPLVSQISEASEALDAEVEQYIRVFSTGSIESRRTAIDDLGWSGINDPRLFDVIEQKLLDSYQSSDGDELDASAWLAKALAYSGDMKYRGTLEKIAESADSRKMKKHTDIALEMLPKYRQWNKVIGEGIEQASSAKELNSLRLTNMLQSDVPEMIRYAGKRLYNRDRVEDRLYDEAEKTLLKYYQDPATDDNTWVDTLAWLCKALGSSGKPAYGLSLSNVIENAHSKKIRKYAKKALREIP